MPTYLFCFGFETPTQHENNQAHGWDDEDSQAVLIEAPSEEEARAWGECIAERFVALLFEDPQMSWRKLKFASWVESPSDEGLPLVRAGNYPDFGTWLKQAREG